MELTSGGLSAFRVPRSMNWKKFVAGSLFCKPSYLLSLWTTVSLCLRNLALHKPAVQSTTYSVYTADFAVNGIMPSLGDETENNCSHTIEDSSASHWWFVTLSNSEDFVLKNVSIVNRQGVSASQFEDFYILYTRNVTGSPNLTTWTVCTYQRSHPTAIVTTFTCDATAIGRRVAIYHDRGQRQYKRLILCEVYVDGYRYTDTVTLHDVHVLRTNNGDIVTAQFSSKPVFLFNFMVVFVNSTQNDFGKNIIPVVVNDGNFSVTIPSMINLTYPVSVAPATCCFGETCLVQSIDISSFSMEKCVLGQRTDLVVIGAAQYSGSSTSTSSANLEVMTSAAVGGAIACIVIVIIFTSTFLLMRRRKTMTAKKSTNAGQATVGREKAHSINVVNFDYDNCKTASQTTSQISSSSATISNEGLQKEAKQNNQQLENCENDYSKPNWHDLTYASLNKEAILYNREEYAALS